MLYDYFMPVSFVKGVVQHFFFHYLLLPIKTERYRLTFALTTVPALMLLTMFPSLFVFYFLMLRTAPDLCSQWVVSDVMIQTLDISPLTSCSRPEWWCQWNGTWLLKPLISSKYRSTSYMVIKYCLGTTPLKGVYLGV